MICNPFWTIFHGIERHSMDREVFGILKHIRREWVFWVSILVSFLHNQPSRETWPNLPDCWCSISWVTDPLLVWLSLSVSLLVLGCLVPVHSIIVNNLADSVLWHQLTVISLPNDLLTTLPKGFVDFLWRQQLLAPSWTQGLIDLIDLIENNLLRSRCIVQNYLGWTLDWWCVELICLKAGKQGFPNVLQALLTVSVMVA